MRHYLLYIAVLMLSMLTGCTQQGVPKEESFKVEDDFGTVDYDKQQLIKRLEVRASYRAHSWYYFESAENNYVEIGGEAKGYKPNPFNEDIENWDEKLTPGLLSWAQDLASETKPRVESKVINNVGILMGTGPLVYQEASYPETIKLYAPLAVLSPELEQYLKAFNLSRYIYHAPIVYEEGVILELNTPSFIDRLYIRDQLTEAIYYAEDAMSYKLYLEEGKLIKIECILKHYEEEAIDDELFKPLVTLARDKWEMEVEALESLDEITREIIDNSIGKKEKGKIGNFEYEFERLSQSQKAFGETIGDQYLSHFTIGYID